MLFNLGTESVDMQNEVILTVGVGEILRELAEICEVLSISAQEAHRAIAQDNPCSDIASIRTLQECASNALLVLDYLETAGVINADEIMKAMEAENKRRYANVVGK